MRCLCCGKEFNKRQSLAAHKRHCKLNPNFDEDKYIDVTLDDTQYVFIAVPPVNDRMNVQSSWGEGVLINSYKLINGEESFEEYYKKNLSLSA